MTDSSRRGEFSPNPQAPEPYPSPLDPPSTFRDYLESKYEHDHPGG